MLRILFSFLTLSIAATASAALITVPDVTVVEGTSEALFVVQISGTERITGITAAIVQVGDGGPLVGGSESTPKIKNVDFSSSILSNLETAPGGLDPFTDFAIDFPSAIVDPGKTLLSVGPDETDFAIANGELFRFTLDTSSLKANDSFRITMDTINTLGQAVTLDAFGTGNVIIPSFLSTGSISVIAVPEPSSLVLLLGAGATCALKRRRKLYRGSSRDAKDGLQGGGHEPPTSMKS